MMTRALALLFLAVFSGCLETPTITCMTDRACVLKDETPGVCVKAPNTAKYCAFPAANCPSGWRWGEFATIYSKQCIDPALLPADGGVDGAPTDAGADGGATDGR